MSSFDGSVPTETATTTTTVSKKRKVVKKVKSSGHQPNIEEAEALRDTSPKAEIALEKGVSALDRNVATRKVEHDRCAFVEPQISPLFKQFKIVRERRGSCLTYDESFLFCVLRSFV